MAILSGYNDHQSSFLGECPISFSDEPKSLLVTFQCHGWFQPQAEAYHGEGERYREGSKGWVGQGDQHERFGHV